MLGRHYVPVLFIILLLVLGKVTGLFRDILLTYFFGVSALTDAYFLAATISSIVYIGIYSAIPMVIVPAYAGVIRRDDQYQSHITVVRTALFLFLSISLCLAGFVALFAPEIIKLLSQSSTVGTGDAHGVAFLRVMVASFVFSTLVSSFVAFLTVQNRSIYAYAVPVAVNIVFCLGFIIFGPSRNMLAALITGQFGWILWAFILFYPLRASVASQIRGAQLSMRNFLKIMRQIVPTASAFYVEQGALLVCVALASQMATGSVSIFSYASKLHLLFLSMFILVLNSSLFPKLAIATSSQDRFVVRDLILKWCRLSMLLAIPTVGFLVFFATQVVSLIFERGTFSAKNTEEVSYSFMWLTMCLPFAIGREILNKLLFSLGRPGVNMLISAIGAMLLVALTQAGLLKYGVGGIVIGWAISVFFQFTFLAFIVQFYIKVSFVRPTFLAGFAALFASSASILVAWPLHYVLNLGWIFIIPCHATVTYVVLLILKVPEAIALRKVLIDGIQTKVQQR